MDTSNFYDAPESPDEFYIDDTTGQYVDKKTFERSRWLCVDGHEYPMEGDDEDSQGSLVGDGEFAPFFVFDIGAQDNIAGPFHTRNAAERAMSLILTSGVY